MSPIFVMASGIVVLLLLPAMMSPGTAKDKVPPNSKHAVRKHPRCMIDDKQLDAVVEKCMHARLRATDFLLIAISILNVTILYCALGLQNEVLLRISQVWDAPPSYEEAMRQRPNFQYRST